MTLKTLKLSKKTTMFIILNIFFLGLAKASPPSLHVENAYSSINRSGDIKSANGRIVFPLGIYSTFTDIKDLNIIKSLGLNTITSYNYGYKNDVNEFIKNAQDNGLYVVLSLKDFYSGLKWAPKDFDEDYINRYLNSLKHKENIIGFNINDELPPEYTSQILNNYKKIRKNGYNQPIIQVLSEKQEKYLLVSKNSADILSIDSYPIGIKKDLSSVSQYVKKVKAENPRSTWAVIQIMSWSLYKRNIRYYIPTTDEIKNQAYQAIIAGANGILFYSYNDLFYKDFGRNIKNMQMGIENTSNLKNAIPEIKKLIRISLSAKDDNTQMLTDGSIVYKYYSTKNEKWLAIVNTSYNPAYIRNSDLQYELVKYTRKSEGKENIYIPPLYSNLINLSN